MTSSSVSVTYTTPGSDPITIDSAAVAVDINEPDIVLSYPPHSGQDQVAPLGTGQLAVLFILIGNDGYGEPPTRLTIDLPAGLALGPDGATSNRDGWPLACTLVSTGQLSCPLGRLAHNDFQPLTVQLTPTPAADPGTDGTLTLTATPDEGVEQNPANNSQTATVHFTGTAHLELTLAPALSKVTVGKSTVVTVTVRNDGPQPADLVVAGLGLKDEHFSITGFDGNTTPPKSPVPNQKSATLKHVMPTRSPVPMQKLVSLSHATNNAAQDQNIQPDFVEWFITALAPGQTATAHVIIRAASVGSTILVMGAFSTAGDPACDNTGGCFVALTLTAIAHAPTVNHPVTTQTSTPASTPTGGTELANTGPTPWPADMLGIGMLLLGSAAVRLGRARLDGTDRPGL
jgi:hypothetical protein